MVERIRMLLEVRQLTPTQFADAIGVARPIVSHILSGRNKPSLEVVQRILAAMPDLSMPWLLNGTGAMLANAPIPTAPAPSPTTSSIPQPGEVAEGTASVPLPDIIPEPSPAPSALPRARRNTPASQPTSGSFRKPPEPFWAAPKRFAPQPRPLATVAPPDASSQPEPVATTAPSDAAPEGPSSLTPSSVPVKAAELLAGTEKPIRRIVIFYRDGSFADYQPEQE